MTKTGTEATIPDARINLIELLHEAYDQIDCDTDDRDLDAERKLLKARIAAALASVDAPATGEQNLYLGTVTIDVGEVLLAVQRRDYLFRNAPKCPACGEVQVQCVDWMTVPSRWKCRECPCKFPFEPAGAPADAPAPVEPEDIASPFNACMFKAECLAARKDRRLKQGDWLDRADVKAERDAGAVAMARTPRKGDAG